MNDQLLFNLHDIANYFYFRTSHPGLFIITIGPLSTHCFEVAIIRYFFWLHHIGIVFLKIESSKCDTIRLRIFEILLHLIRHNAHNRFISVADIPLRWRALNSTVRSTVSNTPFISRKTAIVGRVCVRCEE